MAEETEETPTFSCVVVTPMRTVATVDKIVDALFIAEDGEYEIQARHEPVLLPLKVGLLKLMVLQPTENNEVKEQSLVIHGGFLDMNGKNATVFAYSAERGDEIDLKRAKKAEKRARERIDLSSSKGNARYGGANLDVDRAQRALARSIARQSIGAAKQV